MAGKVGHIHHNPSVNNTFPFFKLPPDVFIEIFTRTSFKAVGLFALTCKGAYEIVWVPINTKIFEPFFLKFKLTIDIESKSDIIGINDIDFNEVARRLEQIVNSSHSAMSDYIEEKDDIDSKEMGSQMGQILDSLPPLIKFPQPDGPMVVFMRSWFENLIINIRNDQKEEQMRARLIQFRESFYPEPLYQQSENDIVPTCQLKECPLDQQFVYNLPLEWLGASTLVEVQEISRRFGLGEKPVGWGSFEEECTKNLKTVFDAHKMLLRGISCELLEDIFKSYPNTQYRYLTMMSWFPGVYLWYGFENLDEQDHANALKKLIVWGTFYKNNWHRFETGELWIITFCLFLHTIRYSAIKVDNLHEQNLKDDQLHPLINSKEMLTWIPEFLLLSIGELLGASEKAKQETEKLLSKLCNEWEDVYNRKKKIDVGTGRKVLEFLKAVAATASPEEIVDVLILKICCKDRRMGYQSLKERGEIFKKNCQTLQPKELAYRLLCLLLPAMFLLDDRLSDETWPILTGEEKLHLKKSLCSWILKKYDDPTEALGDSLLLAREKVQALNFPPCFPCTIEEVFAFITRVRKEVSEIS